MITAKLVLTTISVVIGSSFQYGYHTGVLNDQLNIIDGIVNSTHNHTLITDNIRMISNFIVISFPIGGLFGAMAGGCMVNTFGRKMALLLTSVPTVIGSFLMVLAYFLKIYYPLIIGRLVIGVACGIYTCVAPLYLTEISPLQIRGATGTFHQLFVVIGALVSQVLGLKFILGSNSRFYILLGLSVIPSIIQFITLCFCYDSPRYLLITKGYNDKARKALIFLRGTDDVEHEIQEMLQEKDSAVPCSSLPVKYLFIRPYLRLALLISIGLQISQPLSGINTVTMYAKQTLKSSDLSQMVVNYGTFSVGVTSILMTLISMFIVDFVGRRTLLMVGLSGMLLSVVFLSISVIVYSFYHFYFNFYISTAFIFLFVASFGIGPGPIPWFMVSEMFTQRTRGSAMSLAVFLNWFGQIIIAVGYPHLLRYLKQYYFLPFVVLLSIFIIFTWKCVPETKGRTSEEIENYFKRKYDRTVEGVEPLLTNTFVGPLLVDDFDYRI